MLHLLAKTRVGLVKGQAVEGGIAFKGIPFAAPPVGPRRFCPPEPVESWEGIREATQFGPACPQVRRTSSPILARMQQIPVPLDEDCLYLNVWTPTVNDVRLPTMVWLHGGGFVGTGCTWPFDDGAAFIRDDVILVTINYRLGPFGFLYLDELFDQACQTSNLGLLDQIAALEWVRDNIAAFGGDPDNVTVFGESFGAVCVQTLLGMPGAHGLFRRAISQSAVQLYRRPDTAHAIAQQVLKQLGVRAGDWAALATVPASRLVEASLNVRDPEPQFGSIWKPIVDGITLPDTPTRLVAAGHAKGMELLVGYNADEWRILYFGSSPGTIPAPNLASLFATSGLTPEEVYATYAASRSGATEQDVSAAVESDLTIIIPTIRLAQAQLRHMDRVWLYQFDWSTPVLGGILGAFHMLDLPFTFERYDNPALLGDDPPQELGRDLHGALVRFAATGDPNGGALPHWPGYDLHQRQTMLFDSSCAVAENPRAAIRELWEHVEI